jgi:hypothetical protein
MAGGGVLGEGQEAEASVLGGAMHVGGPDTGLGQAGAGGGGTEPAVDKLMEGGGGSGEE